MKKLKCVVSLVLVMMLLASIVGCGGTSNTDKNSSNQATEAKEPITLRIAYWGGPGEKKAMEDTCKLFSKKFPNITVDTMHIPSDFQTKMQTMLASGTEPDLSYGNIMSYSWAKAGKLVNIYELFDKYPDPNFTKEDFFDFAWYEWEPGKCMGAYIANGLETIMYNPKLFKDAGIDVPPLTADTAWTWDQFVDVAKRLTIDTNGKNATEADFDPTKIKQYGVRFDHGWWMPILTMVRSNGGDIITPDGKGFGYTKPEAIEAIQKMADIINKDHVCPSITASGKMPNVATSLQTGQVAMVYDGSWCMADLSLVPDFKFGVGVLPKMKELKYIIGSGLSVIFKSTKHLQESWELYKFVNNPEYAIELHKGLWMPQMPKWYTDPALIEKWASPTLPGRPEGFQTAVMKIPLENNTIDPETNIKNFDMIDALVAPALDSVWLGKKTAEEAMKEIEPKVLKLIDGFYTE